MVKKSDVIPVCPRCGSELELVTFNTAEGVVLFYWCNGTIKGLKKCKYAERILEKVEQKKW